MRKINFFKAGFVIFVFIFIFSVVTYAKTMQNNIADSVLRLHILANSNSQADMELKLRVRDRIIEEGITVFDKNSNLAQAEQFVRENSDYIKKIAEDEIRKCGYSYSVRIIIDEFPFPARFYDSIMLPSGKYKAVRIIIGEGKGENWWCVMYPPMCVIDKVTVENGKQRLKNSLSGEEYRLISKETPPAEIRFKIVDVINSVFEN